MNKTILWVIVAIIIVGGGYWLYASGKIGGSTTMMNENATSTSQTQSSGTIKDLVALGGSQQCQVNELSSGSAGTVYINAGKVRGDFTSQTSAGAVTSHMISDGQNVYVWSNVMPQGMKMSITSTSSGTSSQENIYDESVNYTCSPWTADSSEFSLPAGVSFEDVNALQGSASTSSGVSAQCSACDQITNASAKAQCKAALHC